MVNLEFGMYDPLRGFEFDAASNAVEVYDQHIREVQIAEQLGYRYYFIIEHQSSDVGKITSPTIYLTSVARRTSVIRFGAMVFPLPFHHPVRLAQDAAMLDHLSHGRLEFGMGLGVSEHEFTRLHIPFDKRREMAEEAMDIIVKSWTEDSLTYQGQYWTFDEALPVPKCYQDPHPPIWVGAHSLPSFEYAAKHNYHVAQNIDIDDIIIQKFEQWRSLWKGNEHTGPMPRTFLTRAVHVAETDKLAREQAEDGLLVSYALGMEKIKNSRIGFGPNLHSGAPTEVQKAFEGMNSSYDFWIDNGLAFVGSPDTVARQLQDSHRRIGYNIFCANFHFGPLPSEQIENSIRLFGEKVIPAFS